MQKQANTATGSVTPSPPRAVGAQASGRGACDDVAMAVVLWLYFNKLELEQPGGGKPASTQPLRVCVKALSEYARSLSGYALAAFPDMRSLPLRVCVKVESQRMAPAVAQSHAPRPCRPPSHPRRAVDRAHAHHHVARPRAPRLRPALSALSPVPPPRNRSLLKDQGFVPKEKE